MTNAFFKQAVFISVIGHIALFSMFSLSFGPKEPEANFTNVSFWGAILRNSDLMNNRNFGTGYKRGGLSEKSEILRLDNINRENLLLQEDYLKPTVSLTSNQQKMVFTQKVTPVPLMSERKGQAIMFYPRLPYHFALYFKDRQTAHIELAFEVISGSKKNSILVKRRISSGNLEADLLSMRYISRYLFIQQRAFTPDKWQVVKIDLSTLND